MTDVAVSVRKPARENVTITPATLMSITNAAIARAAGFRVAIIIAAAIGMIRFSISARSFGLAAMPEPPM